MPFHGPKMAPSFRTQQTVRAVSRIQRIVRGHRKLVAIRAEPERRAQRARPLDLALGVDRRHGLTDLVLTRRREPLAARCPIEADGIEPVTPQLHADGALGVPPEEVAQPSVGDPAPGRHAAFSLLELITVLWIVEEVGEIGEQVQAVVQQESGRTQRRGAVRTLILGGEALAVRLPAITGVNEAETRNEPFSDGAFRHLVGRRPIGPIAHPGQRESVAIVAAAVAQDAVDLAVVVRPYPGSVVAVHLESAQQVSAADARRGGTEQASPSIISPH